jgi:hypothetical protein
VQDRIRIEQPSWSCRVERLAREMASWELRETAPNLASRSPATEGGRLTVGLGAAQIGLRSRRHD